MEETKKFGAAVDDLKVDICQLVDRFRMETGAQNVEVILSSTEKQDKCQITIRF